MTSAYAQLLSVGVLWIGLHCAGMCGPLMLGLDVGGCVSRPREGRAWLYVLAYQLGKSIIYAVMGALAGALGGTISASIEHGAPVVTGLLALWLLMPSWRIPRTNRLAIVDARALPSSRWMTLDRLAGRLKLLTVQLATGRTLIRSMLLGILLSAIPCMVVLWALTLAASTRSALHGALVMLVLVVMNTAPLVGVTLLPRLVRDAAPFQRAARHLRSVSGLWLLLVAGAAAGFIPHSSLAWTMLGRGYVIMFW